MARSIRVVLFNADDATASKLRSILLSVEGVKIVAEIDEPALLPQAVERISADAAFVHLDPAPEAVLAMAAELIRHHPELPVIGASDSSDGQLILSAMRVGFKEFLPEPLNLAELTAALDKVVQVRHDQRPQGRLISVIGSAGGVGATALATNLAVELADLCPGQNVSVVDLDYRFGQVGTLLDLDPTFTIADLCETPEHLETQLVEKALVEHASGVKALCRPTQFSQAENITAAHCVGVLSTLVGMHAYVVVDGPNRFDSGAKAVFDLSDVNLLLLHLSVPSVRSARRMLDGLRDAGYNLDRTQIVCNRMGRDTGTLSLEDVESTLNRPVFAVIPDDWQAMSHAVNMGDPLLSSAPRSKVRIAISELAARLHKPDGESDDKEGARKGRKRFGRVMAGQA